MPHIKYCMEQTGALILHNQQLMYHQSHKILRINGPRYLQSMNIFLEELLLNWQNQCRGFSPVRVSLHKLGGLINCNSRTEVSKFAVSFCLIFSF